MTAPLVQGALLRVLRQVATRQSRSTWERLGTWGWVLGQCLSLRHPATDAWKGCWIQSSRGTLRMSRQHLASVKVLRYVLAKLDFLAANVFLHTEVISIWSHQWAVWYANPSGLKDSRMQY